MFLFGEKQYSRVFSMRAILQGVAKLVECGLFSIGFCL